MRSTLFLHLLICFIYKINSQNLKIDIENEIKILAQCEARCYEKQAILNVKLSKVQECQTDECKQCVDVTLRRIERLQICERRCLHKNFDCVESCKCVDENLQNYIQNGCLQTSSIPFITKSPHLACQDLPQPLFIQLNGPTKGPLIVDLVIEMNVNTNSTDVYQNTSLSPTVQEKLIVYVIEYRQNISSTKQGSQTEWKLLGKKNSSLVEVPGLLPNTHYQFRTTAMAPDGIVEPGAVESAWIKTFPVETTLTPPSKLIVKSSQIEEGQLYTNLQIEPSNEIFCYHRVFWYSGLEKEVPEKFLPLPEDKGLFKIGPLEFGVTYMIDVVTTTAHKNIESSKLMLNLTTITCLEAFNNSFDSCGPGPVKNIISDYDTDKENKSIVIQVSWQPPEHSSDINKVTAYWITLKTDYSSMRSLHAKPFQEQKEIESNVTTCQFFNVHQNYDYLLMIEGNSQGGIGEKAYQKISIPQIITEQTEAKNKAEDMTAYYIIFIVIFAVLIVTGGFTYQKCKKRKMETNGYNKQWYKLKFTLEKEVPLIFAPPKEMKILSNDGNVLALEDVEMGEVLGEGAFGVVRKGFVKFKNNPLSTTVAIKMAQTPESEKQLLLEIGIMKKVGRHPNIVHMVGQCTNRPYIYLLVEFCPFGDLKTYLTNFRQKMASHLYQNQVAGEFESGSLDSPVLIEKHLISFSRQVAVAMEYLSDKNFVHRDLAARNVLVFSPTLVKLADFGLSKNLYENSTYLAQSKQPLPIKWMAYESIFDSTFTTKSDVWSFGVLLWEIVTMGGTPYPGITNIELINLLKTDYRMEQPSNCNIELYNMMWRCWQNEANKRPTFKELKNKLETMLERSLDYITLLVDSNETYYCIQDETDGLVQI